MSANLLFRLKIWGARDNGIPPRSTPGRVTRIKNETDQTEAEENEKTYSNSSRHNSNGTCSRNFPGSFAAGLPKAKEGWHVLKTDYLN